MSDQEKIMLPEVMVFAGPNGSGKSTITRMAKTIGIYINADDIKRSSLCSDMEAAVKAEELREKALSDKIRSRYEKALEIIPQLVQICDILHVYDNSDEPFRIFKKRKDIYFRWENDFWNADAIEKLTGIDTYSEYKKI
ncbi:ATP-binding cassette domain-containing protein [Butyrivibrio sp. AE3006]|uniref:ATP-binding cassette domain-containing protein n=2 Tax=unclassified Butyrivibrio TaxID=2639466 RepID=UPI00041D39AB|nr:ATP-binding cassette domain-containing protein [Butyrivibrio sp. AE3006]